MINYYQKEKSGVREVKKIAIITARSGSKGLKDKNIRELKGKPLMAYTIEAARESGIFDVVHVSTDSRTYADIAKEYGADVPFLRSDENSTDTAGSWDVVKEVIRKYAKMGQEFETVALLQPTSPLRDAQCVREAYRLMKEKDAKAVISVVAEEHSPLLCNTLPKNLSLDGFIRKEAQKPRQQMGQYYRLNGAIYLVKTALLEENADLYQEGSYAYIMPGEKSVDIDTEWDFKLAEILMGEV